MTAQEHGIPLSTVQSWVKRKVRGNSGRNWRGHWGEQHHVKITEEHRVHLEEWINSNPAVTLKELKMKLESEVGLNVCPSTVGNAVHGLLYITKKLWPQ